MDLPGWSWVRWSSWFVKSATRAMASVAMSVALTILTALASSQASPLPAIGDTPLKTQAEATFYVAGSPIAMRRLSNVISISILPVRVLALSVPASVRATAGQPYVIPLVLFNNGNVATRYGLSVSSPNLAPPTVLQDTAGNGMRDDDDIALDLSAHRHIAYAGHHALLLTGIVPADAVEGTQYDIDLTAALAGSSKPGSVGAAPAIARVSLLVSAAPQMRVSIEATNTQLDLDDTTNVTARLTNSGERPLQMKETIYIDGQSRDVTLMRYRIPTGMRYADASGVAAVSSVIPGSRTTVAMRPVALFLDTAGLADAVPHYRTRLPAAEVAEVALALDVPLMPHQEQRFIFSLRLDSDVSQARIVSHAEALDRHSVSPVRSNLLIFDVAGYLSPDLAVRIVQDDTAAENTATRVEIQVDNIGTAPTEGTITLHGTVPGMVRQQDIFAERWRCSVTSAASEAGGDTSFICTSTDRIHGSSSMPPIFFTVGNQQARDGIDDGADGMTGGCAGTGRIIAEVSVENEPRRLLRNNRSETSLICRGGAVIRGRAWIDADNTGAHNASDEPLTGWQAQLLQAGKVVHRATTGADGRYVMAGIMPGGGYSLRFLSPQGRIEAPPLAGNDDGYALPVGARRDYANGLLVYDQALEALDYHDQNLALLPTGVIFDAVSGQPLVNARVTLSGPAGFNPVRHLVGPASNMAAVTDGEGRYNFFLTPDAPAGLYQWKAAVPGFEMADDGDILELNEKLHKTAADQVRTAYKVFDTPFAPGPTSEATAFRVFAGAASTLSALSTLSAPPLAHADMLQDQEPRASGYFSMQRVAGAKKVVNNHLGLFPLMASDALFLEKTADRKTVEIVELFHYRLKLGHSHVATRHGFVINDHLPRGLRYVPGSLRHIEGDVSSPLPDPVIESVQGDIAANPGTTRLRFDFSDVALLPGQTFEMTYRVAVGATAAEGAQLISAADAVAGGETARASAAIRVTGGVFSSDAFVLGKVFLDCGNDKALSAMADFSDRPGVPGVRIYLEDGSFAETDRNGNYSLYGLKPLTHVLKMDVASLPVSARALVLDSRNAGRGDSRFLDIRNGELGRGDFALACSEAVRNEVDARRNKLVKLAGADELDSALKLRFDAEPRVDQQQLAVQGDRASGLVDNRAIAVALPLAAAIEHGGTVIATQPAHADHANHANHAQQDASALLKGDTSLRIVNLHNGQIMPNNASDVTVVGSSGSAFVLRVNGEIVSEQQVGQRSVLESRQAATWEYVAVALRSGVNTLSLEQATPDQKSPYRIEVIVPGPPAGMTIKLPPDLPADGKSIRPFEIALFDAAGVRITAPVLLTLRTALGTWITADANPAEPGLQILMKQGTATVFLEMPREAGSAFLSVEHGLLRESRRLQFEPALRPMIAVGIVEGRLTLNDGKIDMAGGAGNNGFERELRTFSQTSPDGRQHVAARTALFLKGKVKGAYLLTASFDSDKDSRERLFRDIEPDKYYPVYGDDSVRGFDAQAAGKLYLRIDKGPAYLIYGDFNTADASEMRQLTQYNRAVSGVRHHFENKTAISNIFASHDSLRQQVITLRAANQRLYPHVMPDSYVPGSERVELISFDRSQPNTGQKSRLLTRHTDYTIDDLSGNFKVTEAQTGFDPVNDGENYYRIVFETDGDGEKSWLYGGDATFRIGEQLRLGATAVEDANPSQPRRLGGVFGNWRIGKQTELNAEFGWTSLGEDIAGGSESGVRSGNGTGWRVAGKHTGELLLSEFSMIATTPAFSNLSAPITGGRSEARLKNLYRIDDRTRAKSEWLHTRDRPERETARFGAASVGYGDAGGLLNDIEADPGRNASYDGLLVGIERDLGHTVKAEAGMRLVRGAIQGASGASQDQTPVDLLTLRGRIGTGVPYLPAASVYTEYEQDVRDRQKRAFTLGADYALSGGGRLYARHELLSSLGSAYEIEENARSYRTLAGIEGDYIPGGRVFSEYRGARPFAERGPETAYGTRNTWQLTERLAVRSSLERIHSIAGDSGRQSRDSDKADASRGRNPANSTRNQSDSTSISTVVAYRYSARLKGSTGLDVHHGDTETSYLSTVGVGYRLGNDWTMLGKNAFYLLKGRGDAERSHTMRMRQRAGLAYRQNEGNRLNGLAYYEHRASRGGNEPHIDSENSHIVSMHVNARPVRYWTLSGRYAGKYKTMRGDNGASKLSGHLLSMRATRDIGARWDAGIAASVFADSMGQRQQAYGVEIGHHVMDDLWLSGGYNVIGFFDRDFQGMAETARGMYFRMRYKFDENSF